MGLPRAFVGFSSTDIHYYRLMKAWKKIQGLISISQIAKLQTL